MSAGVPRPNWTNVPNKLLDEWLPKIDSLGELKVALAIVRATAGWHKEREVLSISTLERMTGLARSTVIEGLKAAHKRGYVDKIPVGQGFAYGLVVDGEVVGNPDQSESRTTGSPTSTGSDPGPVTGSDPGPQIKKGEKKPSGGKKGGAGAPPVDSESVPIWTFDGRELSNKQRRLVLAVHGSYNEFAGQSLSAFRPSNGKPSEGLVRMTGAVLDYEGLELDDWRGLIAYTIRNPWWPGNPSVGAVFGPNVLDNNLAKWRQKGSPPPESSVQSGGRTEPTGEGYDKHVRWD